MKRITQKTPAVLLSLLIMLSATPVSVLAAGSVIAGGETVDFSSRINSVALEPEATSIGEPSLSSEDNLSGVEYAHDSAVKANDAFNGISTDGCHVAARSVYEIKKYVNNHPFSTTSSVTYDIIPDLNNNKIGKLSSQTLNESLNALNVMRYIAGLSEVTLDSGYSEMAQAASFVLCANGGGLSHDPPKPPTVSDEIYELGRRGASKSNLSAGRPNPADSVVWGYMDDSGSSNIDRVGHRRWCLYPSMKKTGFGQVSGQSYYGRYTAMYAHDGWNGNASEYNVSWPAQVMPVEYFGSNIAWSLSTDKYLSNASVKLTRRSDGRVWSFGTDSSDGYFNINNGGYGQTGCIIFRPDNVGSYRDGDIFDVQIKGNDSLDISYTVYFFSLNSYTSGTCYHNSLIHVPETPSTCTESGIKAHYKCANCGKQFADGNEVSGNELVIPALGHNTGEWYSDDDNHYRYCSVCNQTVDYGAHCWDEGREIVPGVGITVYNCTICKRTKVESTCSIIDSGYCGEENYTDIRWWLTEEGLLLISGTGRMSSYTVSYEYRGQIKSVIITDGVTSIGDNAFSYCTGLTGVTIPNSVTSIGNHSFYDCTALPSIKIPSSVTSIGDWTFSYCTGLASIIIPSRVTSIGDDAFWGCTGLTSVTIPNSVTSIGDYVFYGCTNLTDIYCEAESKPDGWSNDWRSGCSAEIHWGWKDNTVYGDVNGDGEITSIDRVTLSRYLAGWEGYETINEAAADVNKDGKINSQDRVILSRYLAKWEGYETLPYVK